MKKFSVSILGVLFFVALFWPAAVDAAASAVVISEVKTDGANTAAVPRNERVELSNTGSAAVNLSGWILEFARNDSTLTATQCKAGSWAVADATHVTEAALTGTIPAGGKVQVAIKMLDDKAGSVRLLQPGTAGAPPIQHDVVGWGSTASPARCVETKQAVIPGNAQRIVRCNDAKGLPSDTDDNSKDFVLVGVTTAAPKCVAAPTPPAPAKPNCTNIELSEIMANPAGSDAGREYIEIYNASATEQSLAGCSVGTSSTKLFALSGTIAPKTYKTYYSESTKLTLTNAGGEVMLVNSTDEVVVKYPELKDDQAWASIDTKWQVTDKHTPSAANVLVVAEGGRGGGDEEVAYAPCPAGKYRNPETNRCKTVAAVVSALVPCKLGQERNLETNRCRSIVTVASALVPCKEGQERNPATNRCRSVLAASTFMKPCDQGEERNPETNRCRKVIADGSFTGAGSGEKPPANQEEAAKKAKTSFTVMGIVGASALTYGAYEFRGDIRNKLAKLRAKK